MPNWAKALIGLAMRANQGAICRSLTIVSSSVSDCAWLLDVPRLAGGKVLGFGIEQTELRPRIQIFRRISRIGDEFPNLFFVATASERQRRRQQSEHRQPKYGRLAEHRRTRCTLLSILDSFEHDDVSRFACLAQFAIARHDRRCPDSAMGVPRAPLRKQTMYDDRGT